MRREALPVRRLIVQLPHPETGVRQLAFVLARPPRREARRGDRSRIGGGTGADRAGYVISVP